MNNKRKDNENINLNAITFMIWDIIKMFYYSGNYDLSSEELEELASDLTKSTFNITQKHFWHKIQLILHILGEKIVLTSTFSQYWNIKNLCVEYWHNNSEIFLHFEQSNSKTPSKINIEKHIYWAINNHLNAKKVPSLWQKISSKIQEIFS